MSDPILDANLLDNDAAYNLLVHHGDDVLAAAAQWYLEATGRESARSDQFHGSMWRALREFNRFPTLRAAFQDTWPKLGAPTPPGPTPQPPSGPGPNRAVVKLGGVFGASYYVSPTDPNLDVPAFAAFLEAHGCTFTQGWLIDAWALGERDATGKFLPGQHDGFIPVERLADGRFDLSKWNEAYFRRVRMYVETLNAHAVWPLLNILELYAWSDRKAGLPFVPNVTKQPYRNNVNGVKWGNPDDRTFGAYPENNPDQLPDAWLKAFIAKVVDTLRDTTYAFKLGNEMPEKNMHWRILDSIRSAGYMGIVVCNRNEDAPGQYWNMQVGTRCDAIEFHGKLDMSYLDEPYPEEANAGRPTTFREMWQKVEPRNVILSSDGGGGNPTHLPNLTQVAIDALKRGASYEHQLALKRNLFFGDGALRMSDLEIDSAFLLSLVPHTK